MKSKWLSAALLLMLSGAAWAQMTQQQQANLPMSDPNSPQYNTVYLPSLENAAPPQERWADRWGAIATDADNAKLGAVVDMTSEKKAKQAALETCKKNGGTNCRVDISYYNQCAVLVTGDSMYSTARGATVEEAEKLGFSKCRNADVNCRVYYSDCSLPVRLD